MARHRQIVLKCNGVVQRATDVPFMEPDIGRLGVEAAAQNLGIAQLMAVAVATAIKKDLIDEILGAPSRALKGYGKGPGLLVRTRASHVPVGQEGAPQRDAP